MKRLLFVIAASASLLSAAIDGTVTNRTTGKPQGGIDVNLIQLGQGMQTAGSVKTDAQGRFRFAADAGGNTWLVQAFHEGVSYSRMIQPGMPGNGISLEVYDLVSQPPAAAKIAEHIIFLEPSASGITVNEIVSYRNDGNVTYNDPKGTLRFRLPAGANGEARVSVSTAQGMPIQRPVQKTSEANVFTVAQPIKPGDTRFNITYSVPPGTTFETKTLYSVAPRIVVPSGVKLAGDGLKALGTEPTTQASIYEASGPAVAVSIEGTAAAAPAAPAAEGGGEDSPGIEQQLPFLYKRLPLILGLAFAILAVGFALLYRKEDVQSR